MDLKINPVEEVEKEIAEEVNQQKLHEKYPKIPENTKIIEKTNTFKFTVKTIKELFKISVDIIIIILVCIGLTTLIYQELRLPFISLLKATFINLF